MERRFAVRKEALLAGAVVSPEMFCGALGRLDKFLDPFVNRLRRVEQRANARTHVSGLLSNLRRKNTESIAYLHDQNRIALQIFIGHSPWDHAPLLTELTTQVGTRLGEPDGVIVFDPSAFPKKGTESVGVQRQWCGRLGKIENCQVGVFMGYASRKEHALVDVRLYLPQSWTKQRKRCRKCHVPKSVRFATRQKLALEMLKERGPLLPHAWIAGDEELGRSSTFRGDLRDLKEHYVLAIPSNILVHVCQGDLAAAEDSGARTKMNFVRVDRWARALPSTAWTKIDVRDGEKGPLSVKIVAVPVIAKTSRRRLRAREMLVVVRRRDESGKVMTDYHLSNGDEKTNLAEFARVAKAEHRIEDCLKRCKSETGLADYEVRTWQGWHHHQALSLIAAWFLNEETRRGKNPDAGANVPANPNGLCDVAPARPPLPRHGSHLTHHPAPTATQRTGAISSLEAAQTACTATS